MTLSHAKRALVAPPINDAGRPLDTATRSGFETSFGRGFERVRVHDDARAHDAARSLDARAYAAGDNIVFGEGQYRPETPAGRGLIAHELAHTVQQAGLAMKANGSLPAGADTRLEAEAGRAAAEIGAGRSAPALTQASAPAALRNPDDASPPPAVPPPAPEPAAPASPPPAGPTSPTATAATPATAPAAGPAPAMPPGFSPDAAAPAVAGASDVTVWLDNFTMPSPKGNGDWVQKAYDDVASGQRLGVILLAQGTGDQAWQSPEAWKEDSKTREYQTAWLNRGGVTSLPDFSTRLVNAQKSGNIKLEPEVETLVKALPQGLKKGGVDIDHIVEKQLGGTSQPSNLQILTSTVNQTSGTLAYGALKAKAEEFRTSSKDWENLRRISMRIKKADKAGAGVEDASVKLEKLVRGSVNLGNPKIVASAELKPLYLEAAGAGETVYVAAKGKTDIDETGKRIVPGVKLATYQRVPGAKSDLVTGAFDHQAMLRTGIKDDLTFHAEPAAAAPVPVASPDAGATPSGDQAASQASAPPAGAEHRRLKLEKGSNKDLHFLYPYLSPGVIKSVDFDAKGQLIGTGVITPKVQFLGPLDIRFGPDELAIVKPIDVAAMNNSAFMKPLAPAFRFTGGAFEIDLMKFKPSGSVDFSAGPAASPLLTGSIGAAVEGGAFVAKGKLKAGKIPGISAGDGEVVYSSVAGWSGHVHASSSAIPGATTDVNVGFRDNKGQIGFYADGSIKTKIRENAELSLGAKWDGRSISYSGRVTVEKPLPMVERIELAGSYTDDKLSLTGTLKDFKYKDKFAGDLIVHYNRKDNEAGKFSGDLQAKTIGQDKMEGAVNLHVSEDGKFSGKGEISYQLTKDIKPKLGVELTPEQRLRLFGEVKIANIPLSEQWPKKGGERKDILKGMGVKIRFPTPIPGLTPFFEVHGSFGIGYGIGPLALTNITVKAELWPLENDPKISANLSGSLVAPGYAELYGTIGAALGAEVFAGALGLKGGIDITPALRLDFNAGLTVNTGYSEKGFAFEAEAGATAAMVVKLSGALNAEIYGAYGLLSYTWTKPLGETQPRRIGPELKVKLGKLSYSKDKGIVWPNLDQIDYEPKEFHPMDMITDLLGETKPKSA